MIKLVDPTLNEMTMQAMDKVGLVDFSVVSVSVSQV